MSAIRFGLLVCALFLAGTVPGSSVLAEGAIAYPEAYILTRTIPADGVVLLGLSSAVASEVKAEVRNAKGDLVSGRIEARDRHAVWIPEQVLAAGQSYTMVTTIGAGQPSGAQSFSAEQALGNPTPDLSISLTVKSFENVYERLCCGTEPSDPTGCPAVRGSHETKVVASANQYPGELVGGQWLAAIRFGSRETALELWTANASAERSSEGVFTTVRYCAHLTALNLRTGREQSGPEVCQDAALGAEEFDETRQHLTIDACPHPPPPAHTEAWCEINREQCWEEPTKCPGYDAACRHHCACGPFPDGFDAGTTCPAAICDARRTDPDAGPADAGTGRADEDAGAAEARDGAARERFEPDAGEDAPQRVTYQACALKPAAQRVPGLFSLALLASALLLARRRTR